MKNENEGKKYWLVMKKLLLNSVRRLFVVMTAMMLSMTAFAANEDGVVQEVDNTYNYFVQNGNMYIMTEGRGEGLYVEGVTDYLQIESQDRFYRLHSVLVYVGVSERQSTEGVSSSVRMSVNGQEVDIPVQGYREPNSIQLESYTFAVGSEEESGVYIDFSVQGQVGIKIEYVTVWYEPDPSIEEYNIWVTNITGEEIRVTNQNRLDILGDGGTVQYNGDRMMVLNNAKLRSIDMSYEDMVLYLKGDSKIEAGSGTALSWSKMLTITTEGNDPGSLTLQCNSPSLPLNPENIIFEQNLVYMPPTSWGSVREGLIAVPIDPLVNLGKTNREVLVTTNDNLDNKVYDDVLYNLNSEDGNGYDPVTQSIAMVTTMYGEDIDAIISAYKPGSLEFAQNFAGITFLVPAGTGNAIVVGHTSEEGVLNVKIGNHAPFVIPSGVMTNTRYVIPYDVEEATYVYVYSDSPVKTVEAAGDRRAGKKTTMTVGVGSVGVEANTVHNSNPNPGDASGIKTIVSKEQRVVRPQGWYSISGHRLQGVPTQKGLYIFGGRKYVIK